MTFIELYQRVQKNVILGRRPKVKERNIYQENLEVERQLEKQKRIKRLENLEKPSC